ncbi:MAG: hypothetical protein J7L57_00745, partial [Deltaproteobacteria bacterium]|nr:hypothetical protein [Candidatus Tharpella sp.]
PKPHRLDPDQQWQPTQNFSSYISKIQYIEKTIAVGNADGLNKFNPNLLFSVSIQTKLAPSSDQTTNLSVIHNNFL